VKTFVILDLFHALAKYFDSARVSIICPVSCSLLSWALNDSAYPFRQEHPGSMNAVAARRCRTS
jgi:hypothetical protein